MFVDGVPVHFTYEGDFAEVGKWLAFAKHLFTGLPQRGLIADEQVPAEGVFVRAFRLQGSNKIHIKADSSCSLFESGLVDVLYPPQTLVDGIDPRWTRTTTKGKTERYIAQVYKRHREDDGSVTYGPWADSVRLAGNFTTEKRALSFMRKKPGMFTGAMRKVVQVLIGQGKPVPYEALYYFCHGVTVLHEVPWVIEISIDKGVIAWKLPICKNKASTQDPEIKALTDELGYYPISTTLESAKPKGKYRTLLSAAELSNFYNGTFPLFDECGWAFHPNGLEAINTTLEKDGSGYLVGSYYRLSINTNDTGPESATLALAERGYVYGDRINHIKIPFYLDDNLISFDWYAGKILKPASTWSTPVYAYFDNHGQEVILRSYRGDPATASPTNTFPSGYAVSPAFLGEFKSFSGGSGGEAMGPIMTGFPDIPFQRGYASGVVHINTLDQDFGDCTLVYNFSMHPGVIPGQAGLYSFKQLSLGSVSDIADIVYVIPFWERQFVYQYVNSYVQPNVPYTFTQQFQTWMRADMMVGLAYGQYWSNLPGQPYIGTAAVPAQDTPHPVGPWSYIGSGSGSFPLPWGWLLQGVLWQTASFVVHPDGNHWEPTYQIGDSLPLLDYTDSGSGLTGHVLDRLALSVIDQDGNIVMVNANPAHDFLTFYDGSNSHFINAVTDCFGTGWFACTNIDDMQGVTAYKFGLGSYPVVDLSNSIRPRFFMGKP